MPSTAMEEEELRSEKPRKVRLEETIPEGAKKQAIVKFLKTTPKASIHIEDVPGDKRRFGYAFPPSAPWCLLVAKYIKSKSWGERPNLGDWGCGYGFFSVQAVLSGANPWALELGKAVATKANENIWGVKKYLSSDLKLKDLYRVSQRSVVDPGPEFMARQNHINVAFNVMHYLCPTDADLFLQNLYSNTADNGLVFLSVDAPFAPDGKALRFYNERKAQGVKYPGYGVYSAVISLSDEEGDRSVLPVTEEEEKSRTFEMGRKYPGLHSLDAKPVDADEKKKAVTKVCSDIDIFGRRLSDFDDAYHKTFNKFEYEGLKKVLESAGFSVINGWYTDQDIDILYPVNIQKPPIHRETVVVVAQKRVASA